jgi:OmcA/MtrC family decaheme c-type cytochrome
VIEVLEAQIEGTVATATVKITDEEGTPLDREGRYTEGAVSLSFVLAHLGVDGDGDPGQYTSYTTNAIGQASGESNGTFEELGVAEGTYRYTFATPITVAGATATHTLGVYGRRTFEGVQYGDDDTLDFVPDGSAVTMTRAVVDDGACAQCHDTMEMHGGSRKSIALCVTCHTGQSTDPETGNTVDMRVMVHKIHRGAELPSVAAGVPYQIVGYNNSVHDYSDVVYPHALPDCATCHRSEAAAQADYWKTKPTVASCTSCHDDLVFTDPDQAWQVRHIGEIEPTDDCSLCHGATSGVAPITEVHMVPELAADRTEPFVTIQSVANTAPGELPTITFTVLDRNVATGATTPRNIRTSPLTTLRATFAGPNTDFARYWQQTISTTNGTLVDVDAANGVFAWTVPAAGAIPLDATGSYTVGIENALTYTLQPGYYTDRGLTCPPTSNTTCRVAGTPPRFAFPVTDDEATPRRQVVSADKCNACHTQLSFHGGGREDAEYCTLCHNANNVNEERVSRWEGAGEQPYVHTVHFKKMIHGIHMGEELTQPYLLGGNPSPSVTNPAGTMHDFGEVRYPSDPANCTKCHVGTTYRVPLEAPDLLPSFDQIFACNEDPLLDDDSLCEPFSAQTPQTNLFVPIETITYYPEASACLGCHDAPHVAAHAWVMTTQTGLESCATCHGPGGEFDVDKVHGLE